jgi:hypothetical protein
MLQPSVRFGVIARRNGRQRQPGNTFADVSRYNATDGTETGHSNADFYHLGSPSRLAYAGVTGPASLTPSSPGSIFSGLGGEQECVKSF